MALDPKYFVTSDLDTYFVTAATGQPLANGILTFYRDSARTVLKPIYTLTGAPPYGPSSYVQLPNPLTLSNVGTVQDANSNNVVIYYYPFDNSGNQDLYYVTCTDSGLNPEFTREAWPNSEVNSGSTPSTTIAPNFTENQLSNPTFTNLFLNPGIANVFSVSAVTQQVFPLGPDWDFVISGTGNVTVTQVPIAGVSGVPSSPPYVLDVKVDGGITQCFLRQRFIPNSGLWATVGSQNIYLSGSFVAINQGGGSLNISMIYAPSGSASPITIFTGIVVNGIYKFLTGGNTTPIPVSSDVNRGNLGYIDIYVSFPSSSEVRISSIQLIPSVNLPSILTPLSPDLNSSNRDEAYQADYYIPRLNAKQIDSYLVGWDFPVNPCQFGNSSVASPGPGPIDTTAGYIVDQTIAKSVTGNVNWGRDTRSNGLEFTTAGTNDAFYVLQYLQFNQVYNMVGNTISVNVNGYQLDTIANNPITMRVYLFGGSRIASVPTLPTTIGTLNADGTFTLTAANWRLIDRRGLPVPQTTLNLGSYTAFNGIGTVDYGFSGWDLNDPTQYDTAQFAIVVTFAYVNPNTDFTINSISVTPGDIPSRPAVKTRAEVLSDCQFYYQTSFLPSPNGPRNAAGANSGETYSDLISASAQAGLPKVNFPVQMRFTPTPVTLYNPVNNNSQIYNIGTASDFSGSGTASVTANGFITNGTAPGGSAIGNLLAVHWSADCRVGIV